MIDLTKLVDDFENVKTALVAKYVDAAQIDELRDLVIRRKKLTTEKQEKQTALNQKSKEVGAKYKEGKKDEGDALKAEVAQIKDALAGVEAEYGEVDERLTYLHLTTANIPLPETPRGKSADDNVLIKTNGYNEKDYEGKTFTPHWEIAENLGLLDMERGAKISGSMFAVYRGRGAKLLRSLVQFGLKLNEGKGYEEIMPPHYVRSDTFRGTGHLPKMADDAYAVERDDLWAIPTAEVALTGLYGGEILDPETLPKCMMGYTACFRREAGAAGSETRGLQRLHEFHKVELVKICLPEQSYEEHEKMLADCERSIELLELPYRVIDLCTGDLGFHAARTRDIEVWAPGTGKWLEVSSVGIFTDYQSRRLNIRYKKKEGGTGFVHFLNGSGLATPRVFAAILEHNLQEDGSVVVPKVLREFYGADVIEPA